VIEPAPAEAQEASLLGAVEQYLGDGQAEHLGIRDAWPAAGAGRISRREEFVCQHVKCDQKVVEVGGHVATSGW
jgi:hypothetical protein